MSKDRNGLTMTMVFLAESANYGEGIGNISMLKKMSRGDYEQYSYISRQAIRYNIVQQLKWDTTPVEEQNKVVQFAPAATIEKYPEIDLFGYMKTTAKDASGAAGGADTRRAVVRLSHAIALGIYFGVGRRSAFALEPYQSDLEFLTNMGLAKRQNLKNVIAQSEIQRSYYAYTVSIDLERVGVDGGIEITAKEKADRVVKLLETLEYLYRDIKGRRENLAPLFMIGGRYARKNPFFENRVKVQKEKLNVAALKEILEDKEIEKFTVVGVAKETFANDVDIREKLGATGIARSFAALKKEVKEYYEGN